MPESPHDRVTTHRLTLTPLVPGDAAEMRVVLGDVALYEFTGGSPPDVAELEERYRYQVAGSPTPGERWFNWIVRLRPREEAVGFVQATVIGEEADLAWVVGTRWQRRGIAAEAAAAMCRWLAASGVQRFAAHIHPEHVASAKVAASLGLARTEEIDEDGEVVWRGPAAMDQLSRGRSVPRS